MTIYIDAGSSTIKVYKKDLDDKINLMETKSFHFKKHFDPKNWIKEKIKNELIQYFKQIKDNFPDEKIKIFATAFFRNLNENFKQNLIDDIFQETGLFFNIISQDLESFYLEKALVWEYHDYLPILLINIGWGSTELIIKEKWVIIQKYDLDIWVWTVLNNFPDLNNYYSKYSLEEVVNNIKSKLPKFEKTIPIAIYNWWELTYMNLVWYNLKKNNIFSDPNHPFYIDSSEFASKNNEVFKSISIKDLENLMPKDPAWMHWARSCSAIAQAIIENFWVEKIIPSDSNTIDWIIKQEYSIWNT